MPIDKTEAFLKKFDYNFQRKNNALVIKMDFSQRVTIDFSDAEKIRITYKLVGWNSLTGFIEMSIKNATLYSFIGVLITTVLFVYLDLESNGINLIFIFISLIMWVLIWNIYYLIKAENLKRILILWNKK
ncbi:hypothetical protein BZARG_3038 [Bizionia argentinensis JUB59]|uniref:Uncharacterized protein n=1 Tax=Bizionia argentinensis JUB59 TaxID=1046627 RepID=G2EFE8_9FLAO|nr:hypothetical protein [Bizionia argentinensis]EGV42840.1 hypothetical protein BZARG_3038 [Bizionia argentinensis JUB59]